MPAVEHARHDACSRANHAAQRRSRLPLAFLRPTLIYGANDPHNGYGPNRFRRQAAKGETITLFGEGEEKRDHVPVDDVAALVSACVAAPQHRHAQYRHGRLDLVSGDRRQ